MTFNNKHRFLALCLAIVSTGLGVLAQSDDDFCTPTAPSAVVPLNLTSTTGALRLGWETDSCPEKNGILAPETIHWHIYALEENEGEEARIAMSPANLVQPELKDGTLQFRLQELDSAFYDCGDYIQAGVALWLPASSLTSIDVAGVTSAAVEIQYDGTTPLILANSGIGNSISVTSLQAPVEYTGSGIETQATIVATGAVGSRVTLTGINGRVAIAVPPPEDAANSTILQDELLQVSLSGVDIEATIDGAYGTIVMSGLEAQAIVNTNCDRIVDSGLGTGCYTASNLTVVIEEENLSCLSDTEVAKVHMCLGNWENWRGAVIGASVGVLVVLLLCIGGCVACCFLCGRRGRRKGGEVKHTSDSSTNTKESKEMPAFMGRVVDPEAQPVAHATAATIPIDPHLITAKTGTETSKTDFAGAYS